MSSTSASSAGSLAKTLLVVGATGQLGTKLVGHLLEKGHHVRALVRPASDPTKFTQQYPKVEIVRGDMMDPASLKPAFAGCDAIVTTAAGYTKRQKSDDIKTDIEGNRHLVDAAKDAGTSLFVLCSILTCDHPDAANVPHFHAKAVTENYLREQKVPFVALRPGAFLSPQITSTVKSGYLVALWDPNVKVTFISVEDVARCLAAALDQSPQAVNGKTIDLGSDRAVSMNELGLVLGKQLNKEISVKHVPHVALSVASVFSSFTADMKAMGDYFDKGTYIADTTEQAKLFPPLPTIEEGCTRLLQEMDAQEKQSK